VEPALAKIKLQPVKRRRRGGDPAKAAPANKVNTNPRMVKKETQKPEATPNKKSAAVSQEQPRQLSQHQRTQSAIQIYNNLPPTTEADLDQLISNIKQAYNIIDERKKPMSRAAYN